ncbi:MAG: protoheme IX farnesyltransferase [Actinomycetia bacterium]|nr:protoheme IX farnesyltransferase [Actinomycetes bacterium]MCP4223123.1 protoheme IX farnesyltransferase [Actinomycetes bacterium]MCP5032739.1 protoheme IX farnesyltransferase [Actinomycetes bacterium]
MAFVALTKPRIIELLLVTTVPTMVVAHGGLPPLWLTVFTVIGGTLAAGGANAYNMYLDRDIDALMKRTEGRPLVTGEVTPVEALIFASVVEAVAFVWLWFLVNPLSAWLALIACVFYVGVYTIWLKRTSTQNIVIGGAAGAVPALIGWSSVTNEIGLTAVLLFGVIFFWTPPHFWALAIKYEDDYSAASVPMMPVVEGHQKTTRQMVAYSIIVGAITIALWIVSPVGWLYLGTAVVLGILFTGGAVRLATQADPQAQARQAIRYFRFSIIHLTVLFFAIAVDQLVGWGI